jgi:hypothetical protein
MFDDRGSDQVTADIQEVIESRNRSVDVSAEA